MSGLAWTVSGSGSKLRNWIYRWMSGYSGEMTVIELGISRIESDMTSRCWTWNCLNFIKFSYSGFIGLLWRNSVACKTKVWQVNIVAFWENNWHEVVLKAKKQLTGWGGSAYKRFLAYIKTWQCFDIFLVT